MQHLHYSPDIEQPPPDEQQSRARLQVYKALSDFRHRENGVQTVEPSSADQIPARPSPPDLHR